MAIEKFEIRFVSSRGNRYNVPMKQWRKWNIGARQVFNEVYSVMNGNQRIFVHPSQAPISRAHWKTVSWNAAWTAASAAHAAGV